MWEVGVKYHPRAEENSWVSANWHFPVLAVMYKVNFVWYDCDNTMTYAAVKELQKGSYKERTIEKRGLLKPSSMTIGSQWEKRVVCIFNVNHFMNLKELLDVAE